MRNTKQKLLILNIIENSDCHLTADEVYNICVNSIPNISLGTVYRNLNNLALKNRIRRIKMPNNIDRFDKNIVHSHIICSNCGNIQDVFIDYNIKLPSAMDFEVYDYELTFNGICKKCKKER